MALLRFRIEGKDYAVEVGARSGNTVQVTVNGRNFAVEVDESGHYVPAPVAAVAPAPVAAVAPAPVAAAAPAPVAAAAPPSTPVAAPRPAAAGAGEVRAPISGVVLSVLVSPGQVVTARTQIVVLEAMKMENEIYAAIDGAVVSVHVQAQQEVREGDLLVTINPS
jgi:glutaconyl-CoA decarboxylase